MKKSVFVIVLVVLAVALVISLLVNFGAVSVPSLSPDPRFNVVAHSCDADGICEVNHLSVRNSQGTGPYACLDDNGRLFQSETPCHLGFEDFPGVFFDNNRSNFVLVYGVNFDLVLSTQIQSFLYEYGFNLTGGSEFAPIIMDSELFDPEGQNMILVGRPSGYPGNASNEIMDLLDLPQLEPGQSLLKFSMIGDKKVLVVTGHDFVEVQDAVTRLISDDSLEGTEIIW